MATLGMTITGTEIIDGIAYVQSWTTAFHRRERQSHPRYSTD